MGKRDLLTKLLAWIGTLVIWLVLLTPVFFSAMRYIQSSRFRFDWLMPAEFAPAALIGGLLLFWAALRAKSQSRPIAWGLLIAIVMLTAGQAYAVYSGLASGETEATGLPWLIVVVSLGLYVLGLLITGWSGLRLLTNLNKKVVLPKGTARS